MRAQQCFRCRRGEPAGGLTASADCGLIPPHGSGAITLPY
jgi:hypothetical protein